MNSDLLVIGEKISTFLGINILVICIFPESLALYVKNCKYLSNISVLLIRSETYSISQLGGQTKYYKFKCIFR